MIGVLSRACAPCPCVSFHLPALTTFAASGVEARRQACQWPRLWHALCVALRPCCAGAGQQDAAALARYQAAQQRQRQQRQRQQQQQQQYQQGSQYNPYSISLPAAVPKSYPLSQPGLSSSSAVYGGHQAHSVPQQHAGNGQHHGAQHGLGQKPAQEQPSSAVQQGYPPQAAYGRSEAQPYTSPLKQQGEGLTPSGLPTWGSTGIRASHATGHHARGSR